MANYIFRRLMLACLTLLLVTNLVFGLMRAMPGSPLTLNLEDTSRELRKEDIEQLKEQYGLNKPWYVAYVHWLGDLATGDLGDSFLTHKDVTVVIGERIGPNVSLFTVGTGITEASVVRSSQSAAMKPLGAARPRRRVPHRARRRC